MEVNPGAANETSLISTAVPGCPLAASPAYSATVPSLNGDVIYGIPGFATNIAKLGLVQVSLKLGGVMGRGWLRRARRGKEAMLGGGLIC